MERVKRIALLVLLAGMTLAGPAAGQETRIILPLERFLPTNTLAYLSLPDAGALQSLLTLAGENRAALADRLVSDSQQRIAEQGLELELTAPSPAWAWVRRHAVEQTLSNLLDNACSYSDRGGRIRVSVAAAGDTVTLRVADSGIGISPGDQHRIFERFYRVDASRSRAVGGTGLGLSIVKHLVQAMGGRIDVESRLGQGSTFSGTLPAAAREHG